MKTITLYNGVTVPQLGLGTWQMKPADAKEAVLAALRLGYRHIDTAAVYQNEEAVGEAIRESGIPRREIFLTTKLPAEQKGYDIAKQCLTESLTRLGVDYVDLYLIHAPWPWGNPEKDCSEGNAACWRAMQEDYKAGKARAIGVSNFKPKDFLPLAEAPIRPMVDQFSLFPGRPQQETVDFCKARDIRIEAYSPLATGAVFRCAELKEMAADYRVSVAQLSIRYCLQKGAIVIPKSIHPQRLRENMDTDFEIRAADMEKLDHVKVL